MAINGAPPVSGSDSNSSGSTGFDSAVEDSEQNKQALISKMSTQLLSNMMFNMVTDLMDEMQKDT